jgi:O-antigen ligase
MTLIRQPGRAEWCFALFALIYFSKAMVSLLSFGATIEGREGSIVFQAIGAAVYLVTFALILTRLGRFLRLCSQNKALIFMVGLAFLSVSWSIDPGLTVRRSVALMGTTAFGIYLVMRFTPEEFCRLLTWTLGILAVLSLVFVVALPQIGVHAADVHTGTWRGVFAHKNGLGRAMGLGSVLFVAIALQGGRHRLLASAGAALCLLLLIMSFSRTGWLIAGSTFSVLVVLQLFRKTHQSVAIPGLMLGGLVLAGAALWAVTNLDVSTSLIGRNATLTGRTYIWSVVVEQTDRDWLGHGFQAFWYGPVGQKLVYLWLNFDLLSAHNGLLELWLDLGYMGIFAFLILTSVGFHRLIRGILYSKGYYDIILPTIFIYVIISSIPTALVLQNSIFWIIFVAALFYIYEPGVLSKATRRQLAWNSIKAQSIET